MKNDIPLKYKDRRTEGDTVLRQCQLTQLHLLYVFDEVCRRHGIEYFLDAGTLLGAIRHNGFIPWDDDLDVRMSGKNYRKFLRVAQSELPADVILQNPANTPERVFAFSKLRDAYSFYAEMSNGVTLRRVNGIFMDVFTYCEIPRLPKRMEKPIVFFCKMMWHYGKALRCSGGRGWLFALFGAWLSIPLFIIHYLLRAVLCVLGFVFRDRMIFYDLKTPFKASFPRQALYPLALHRFEDGVFPVPKDADAVLTNMYGNWKTLPPECERVGGHGKLILPFNTCLVPGAMKW